MTTEVPDQRLAQPPSRFAFVDGLRGFAALGVAAYHIWRYEPHPYPAEDFMPGWLEFLLLKAWVGVPFLLVVSGFVIAFTLRDVWVTPASALSFVGRRIVRLWPPYAVTILLVVVLHAASVVPTPKDESLTEEELSTSEPDHKFSVPPPTEEPLSALRVASHLFFLQDVLGETPLSAGIWTVCIEMQFYIVCVLGWWLAQRLWRRPDPQQPRPAGWGLLLIFAPLALTSLFCWNRQESTEPWVTHFLNSFFLGMVTWWALDRTVPQCVFVATVAVVAGHLALQWKLENALALTAALSIYAAGRMGHFQDWLNWRWLQYLGRISYSLYLIHYPVSHLLMWLCWRWCGNLPTPAQSSVILLSCLMASIAAGHLLYVAVEAPSGRWAARLKKRSTE